MVINGGLFGRVQELRSKGVWQCDLNQNTCSSREGMLRLSCIKMLLSPGKPTTTN